MPRQHLDGTDAQKQHSYSPAVITQGGRIVWLAGHTTTINDSGEDISYAFEAQVRQIFRNLNKTLQRAGGCLADIVTMTVFILDPRLGPVFTGIRREMFADGKYPGSALITVSAFARPGIVVEVQGIAVVDEQ